MKTEAKLWPQEDEHGFKSNLTYWPSFWPNMTHIQSKFDEDWTKTVASSVDKVFLWFDLLIYFLTQDDPYSILTKFYEDWTKTVASRVFRRFFYEVTYWPSFWSNITHIRTWLRYCQDDVASSVDKVFLWFDLLT